MSIWVRSQNEEMLVNSNVFRYVNDDWNENDDKPHCIIDNENNYYLGKYSTKEKALTVLDMIQAHIQKEKDAIVGGHKAMIIGEMDMPFFKIQLPETIFEMPLDSEVN